VDTEFGEHVAHRISPSRWSGSAKLAAAILAVSFACAAVALGLNYFLVRRALNSAAPDVDVLPSQADGPPPPDVLETAESVARSQALRTVATYSFASLAVVFVTGLIVSRSLARRALRPIGEIAAVVEDCTENDLARRVVVSGPDDELARLGNTVNKTLARLEDAFERQRLFVANASHELRTPLTLIRSSADVALSRPEATAADYRNALGRIDRASQRAQMLIDRLLILARVDRGPLGDDQVSLAAIAQEALRETELEWTGIVPLKITECLTDAPVRGDARLLEVAIRNLVDNAHRHNVERGWLRIATGHENSLSWVDVSNSGSELTLDDARRLVEPFHRSSTSAAGAGLGLAITARIVEMHAGALDITPRPGGGLEVRISLPATWSHTRLLNQRTTRTESPPAAFE